MSAENFFERISNGNSRTARIASNFWFAFACLCSPGVFFNMNESQAAFNIADIESWFFPLLVIGGFLYIAYDVRNFAYGKKIHLDNTLYFDATKRNTPVRWLSLVFDLMFSGFLCHIAITQYQQWHPILLLI